ncbi:hypothetical protein AWENTII_005626 [Aspergillus wentii]
MCNDLSRYKFRCLRSELVRSARQCNICHAILTGVDFTMERGGYNKDNVSEYYIELKQGTTLKVGVDYQNTFLCYEIYTSPETKSSWPQLGTATDLEEIMDLEGAAVQIHSWMQRCIKGHSECLNSSNSPLPTRVLDIGCFDSDSVYLYEPTPSDSAPYIALSYCWGRQGNLTTTNENIEARKSNIQWASIPSTMQDAIQLTRRLQIRYIWIDALCIIQNDTKDWDREAMQMTEYYQGAHLVISATRSANANQGIFGPRLPVTFRDLPSHPAAFSIGHFKVPTGPSTSETVHVREFLFHHLEDSPHIPDPAMNPLAFRAWAFQERLLATRAVHLTAQEMIWECKEAAWCECGTGWSSNNYQLDFHNALQGQISSSSQRPEIIWTKMVTQYSQRSLTFLKDKLMAFDGIARQFQTLYLGQYYFGFWEKHLVEHMTWSAKLDPKSSTSEDDKNIALGPSWSWLSTKYPVGFDFYREFSGVTCHAGIRDLPDLSLISDHRTMILYPPCSVDMWHLTLETKVVHAKVLIASYSQGVVYKMQLFQEDDGAGLDQDAPFYPDVFLSTKTDSPSRCAMTRWKWVDEGDIVKCVLLTSAYWVTHHWAAIAVKPSPENPNVYVRVGLVTGSGGFPGSQDRTIDRWNMVKTRKITLI